jgi:hypothetical protein
LQFSKDIRKLGDAITGDDNGEATDFVVAATYKLLQVFI